MSGTAVLASGMLLLGSGTDLGYAPTSYALWPMTLSYSGPMYHGLCYCAARPLRAMSYAVLPPASYAVWPMLFSYKDPVQRAVLRYRGVVDSCSVTLGTPLKPMLAK
eukprot:599230-Rhodomonas_salina.1